MLRSIEVRLSEMMFGSDMMGLPCRLIFPKFFNPRREWNVVRQMVYIQIRIILPWSTSCPVIFAILQRLKSKWINVGLIRIKFSSLLLKLVSGFSASESSMRLRAGSSTLLGLISIQDDILFFPMFNVLRDTKPSSANGDRWVRKFSEMSRCSSETNSFNPSGNCVNLLLDKSR